MDCKKYMAMFLIIISSADLSSADDDYVFGPTVYERTKGSPDIFVDDFSSPEGDFILHVDNGREGGYKISSATIILNGETIVRQNEFNQNVNSINKSIKLKSQNNLQAKLNSKPGGSITLYIHAAPVVEIEFPIKNAYHPVSIPLDGTPVEFKTAVVGTIKGNVTNATIKVNNDIFDAPVINGSFYQNVTLIENGNQISVSATDTLGYTGNADIVAYVENTNKELTMPLPPPNPFENDKLGTGLNYTAYLYETQGMDAAVALISRNPHNIVENGSIRVRIPVPEENETYISTLKSMGIDVIDVINATDIGGEILIEASLPISKIREAGELDFVTRVYVVATPYPESTGEGDAIIGGEKVRTILGFNGSKPDSSRVKVAVIDQAGSSHEAKVMEVIQTIAPGADVTSYSGDWNSGIKNATTDGVDIISVSQSAPHLDLDGTDPISENITRARTNGILYINAAGNWARLHYKGKYQDENNNGWHEFENHFYGYDETLNTEWSFVLDDNVTAYLHLNPADVDKLDFKLGASDTEPLQLDSWQFQYSKGVRGITTPVNRSRDIRIFITNSSKYKSSEVAGTPFHVFVYPESGILDKQHQWVDHPVKESSITAPATSRYSFTVGATYSNLIKSYSDRTAYFAAISGIGTGNINSAMSIILSLDMIKNIFHQDDLAYFSGQGPVYDAAGNTLIKPDVVAPTFVSTSHGIFGGTSASAPHVAGAAALVLSANPYLTPDEVQQALEESSVELGTPGKDNKYGAGRIDVYEAVQKVLPDMRPTNIQAVRDGATENFTIKADINNAGHGVTRNVEVQFLKDGSVFNTSVIPVLRAGDTVTLETKWVPENYGSYNISVIVDPGKKIPELDESNNYANVTVDVTGLPGWGFSKKLSFMGTTAGAQTNYPLKLTVRKGSGNDAPGMVYLGSNVRDDFGDIRFTRSDGVTLLDYWVESYELGKSAEVWVEVDSIPASPGSADVYLYYGNPGAASKSDGDGTFTVFDDFVGSSLNLSKWNVVTRFGYSGNSISVANSKITITADENDGYGIASKISKSGGQILETKGYVILTKPKPNYQTIPIGLVTDNTKHIFSGDFVGHGYYTWWYEYGPIRIYRVDGKRSPLVEDTRLAEASETMIVGQKKNHTLKLDNINAIWDINYKTELVATDSTYQDSLYAAVQPYTRTKVEVDLLFVRSYANPEPMWRG